MVWNPLKLENVFHSEISSSLLLTDLLDTNDNCIKFLSYVHSQNPDFFCPVGYNKELVKREHFIKDKGSIDILIQLKNSIGETVAILIEVKVHDYRSSTRDQIKTYMEAARAQTQSKSVYLIYLTQFTERDITPDFITPGTVVEFNSARTQYGSSICHLSWADFYRFLHGIDLNKPPMSE